MEITFNSKTFDGKWQWLYFIIMDLNDFFGRPFTFVIGDNNTFRNFKINADNWNENSTKYEFGRILFNKQNKTK